MGVVSLWSATEVFLYIRYRIYIYIYKYIDCGSVRYVGVVGHRSFLSTRYGIYIHIDTHIMGVFDMWGWSATEVFLYI